MTSLRWFSPRSPSDKKPDLSDDAQSVLRIAVVRREDIFTLAPWKSALEPMRGRLVTRMVGPTRVTWTLDRGRGLPSRT